MRINKTIIDQQCISNGGSVHVGSLLAVKIENDESKATFEKVGMANLNTDFGSVHTLYIKALSRFLLSLLICPRTETSTEK